jgi:putative ABC transport system permease protein
MGLLARRDLFHERVRFAVTLTGIVLAVVLIMIQSGLFLGFTTTTSNNIDHSNADPGGVFRETLVELDPRQPLPLGLRVDSYRGS